MTADDGALFDVVLEPTAPDVPTRVRYVVGPDGDEDLLVDADEDLLVGGDHRRGPAPRRTDGPQHASAPAYWRREAEKVVLALAAEQGYCTSDDLRARYPHDPSATGAAIGSLFRSLSKQGRLRLAGYQPSSRPEARSRVVGRWVLG